jgi:hypothetical protein
VRDEAACKLGAIGPCREGRHPGAPRSPEGPGLLGADVIRLGIGPDRPCREGRSEKLTTEASALEATDAWDDRPVSASQGAHHGGRFYPSSVPRVAASHPARPWSSTPTIKLLCAPP